MTNFEKFHPLLTANFKLDWLTTVPLNVLLAFGYSAEEVHLKMQQTMRGAQLSYAIVERASNSFQGVLTIKFSESTAEIAGTVKPEFSGESEIMDYLKGFLAANFSVNHLKKNFIIFS
ncbi:hypothetical protein [Xylocopilactobacillus apicola]|uniref:Uncharacterized protein n=1 Tax=Xylocopilactobacillus apicola TaxID=2932184 RepID=A0AAU9DBC9_9LACO|nr:hypothetical protein [Xylocopilactobacillus apicola]BDR59726.1 hypothetical protein XA3_21670 [Xylocopilactobacillus apicola]